MRIVLAVVLGLLGGFLAGIMLDQLIGIVGFMLYQRAFGIRYLPIVLALVCAVVAPWLAVRMQQRAR